MAKVVQISWELEERREALSKDGYDPYEAHYLMRREGGLLLRNFASHDKIPSSFELHHIQTQAKESLEKTSQHLVQELKRDSKDFLVKAFQVFYRNLENPMGSAMLTIKAR